MSEADESISQVFEVHPGAGAFPSLVYALAYQYISISTYGDDSVDEQWTGISGDLGEHSFVMRIV